jgi:chromosome segregation ATPase
LVHAFQEQQKELARLQGQLEAMRRPAEEEQLTDIDRAIRSKVAPVIEPYAKKIQELESKLADRDKRDEQREKDAQTQRELQKLSVEAQQSAEQILLAQVPAEQRKAMQKLGKEMTLVFSSIYGVPAHKAAAYAQRYMEAYRQAVNEGAKQTVRQKVQANKAAPQVSTTQRMATREGVLPRLDVSKLQKAGYGGGDLVDSFFDGFNDSFRRLR